MSFAVNVATNSRELTNALRSVRTKQLPFAVARGLTKLAGIVRDAERDELTDVFTLRNQRVRRGITIEPARKTDWPNSFSEVGTRDDFIARHITGGTKRPERGARKLAIPARHIAGSRTSTGRIRKTQRPGRIMRQKGASTTDRYIRGGTRTAAARRGLSIAYIRARRARIRATYPFVAVARLEVAAHYGPVLSDSIAHAYRTARPR